MKKFKKFLIILLVMLIIGGIAVGGVYAYQQYQQENTVVEVTYVANLNWGFSSDEMTSSGYVKNDFVQSVRAEDKTVAEITVAEGDEVQVGDPILVYDTTESQLQLEMRQLELQGIKNDIKIVKKELEDLEKITPVSSTNSSSSSSSTSSETTTSETSSTTTETEDTYVVMKVQKKDGKAYNYIDKSAKPYEGKGTPEKPFRFLCTQECYVMGSYLNQLVEKEQVAAFEIWTGNNRNQGALVSCWTVSGTERSTVDENSKWRVSTQQEFNDEVILEQESESETTHPQTPASETTETEETEVVEYTAEELDKEITEKESKLKELQIDRKSKKLEVQQIKKTIEDATVYAKINGVVNTVADIENPPTDGSPIVEILGAEGLYVEGSVSELMLEQIEIGQEITANSWSNGQVYTATITEISEYPTENAEAYYGEGNPNVSYYSFMAYIEESDGLVNGDYVDLTIMPVNAEESMNSIYIEKAYVREENGQSYVLKVGEDGCLVKQYVQTGKTLYGSAIEIKAGLSEEDRIAFPYGKTAKEGVKAVESEEF